MARIPFSDPTKGGPPQRPGVFQRDIKERQFEPGDLNVLKRGFEPYTSNEDGQYWLADNHGNRLCIADTSSGNVAITLPAAKDTTGLRYEIKRTTGGPNSLTIATTDGNIDGTTTVSVATQYTCLQLRSDGTNWWIV